jgi:hypothetical protein
MWARAHPCSSGWARALPRRPARSVAAITVSSTSLPCPLQCNPSKHSYDPCFPPLSVSALNAAIDLAAQLSTNAAAEDGRAAGGKTLTVA